uniref:Major facilitator superfamily (MFS) profile domain-containing protein n=1 Tax=Leptobrachium leishanense TaxID=445787 RepID=A0A8C5N0M9_9ANUR
MSETTTNTGRFTRDQILTMVSTASLNFSSMIVYSLLGPFFPQEAVKKGVSNTVIGLIFGCFALFNFSTSLILGKYLVKIGAKFMFVTGMFVSACATILFGLLDKAPDGKIFIILCFVVRAVDAIGFGASITASFSILAKAFPNNIATAMGSLEIFTGLGLVLGPPIGGILYQEFGYEIPFISVGCFILLLVPVNYFVLPKYDAEPTTGSFWMLFTFPKIWLMCFSTFSLSSCLCFLDPTMSLFVVETFHLKVSYVGLVFLGLALSYSLSSPLLGLISDKYPGLRKWLFILGSFGTALCFFMLGPATFFHIESKLWLFIFVLVLDGFCIGLSGIPVYPEMLSCAYENGFEEGLSTLGLISGVFSAMWSLGAFVGPTLGGFLNEQFKFENAAAMQGLFPLLSGILLLIFYVYEAFKNRSSEALNKFTAAVYEHVPFFPNPTNQQSVTEEEALVNMNQNIDVLEKAVKTAARKGAHIVVTPEYAICCLDLSREAVYPYLEDIPDPKENWIPCSDPHRFGRTPVQKRLSCMAKKNSIYLVANFGDKKSCNISEENCPEDGHLIYDTTVVFDTEGKLTARYHKVCTLLKCNSLETCVNAAETSSTRFDWFSLSGTFDSQYVFPEVLLSNVQLAPGMFQILNDGRLISLPDIASKPLLSVTLLGRNYKKDPDINVSLLTIS